MGGSAGDNDFATGFAYDAAGNMTFDGVNSYQYDEESRVAATVLGTATKPSMYYLYNGDGDRVAKLNAADEAELNGPADETCGLVWMPGPITGPEPATELDIYDSQVLDALGFPVGAAPH